MAHNAPRKHDKHTRFRNQNIRRGGSRTDHDPCEPPLATRVDSGSTDRKSDAQSDDFTSQDAKGSIPERCCLAIASAADWRSALSPSSVTPSWLS